MTSKSATSVSARLRVPDCYVEMPLALSFTRFVAAHGGSDSLRATDRPTESAPRQPLTFTRHVWLMNRVPGRAPHPVGNGEPV